MGLALVDTISPASVQAAAVCSGLGDRDRAFDLMEKALAVRDDRLLWIKVDPRLITCAQTSAIKTSCPA